MVRGGGFFTRLYLASKYDDDEARHLSLFTARLLRYFLSREKSGTTPLPPSLPLF